VSESSKQSTGRIRILPIRRAIEGAFKRYLMRAAADIGVPYKDDRPVLIATDEEFLNDAVRAVMAIRTKSDDDALGAAFFAGGSFVLNDKRGLHLTGDELERAVRDYLKRRTP
jgi:hypothetical protein